MAWIRQQIQGSKGETVVHPGQLILNTLACENAELTAQSLEAWFQEYASKRAAMGVNVIFKEASKTAPCLNYGQSYSLFMAFVVSGVFRFWFGC